MNCSGDEDEREYFCGVCNAKYGTDDTLWIECDCCLIWFHTEYIDIREISVPDVFVCFECDV